MRRIGGPVLAGLGAFLLVAGLLAAFYAYPRLAVSPIDQDSITSLEGKNVTLFDAATLSNITTDLSIKNRTVGDVKASESAPDGVRVWVSTTSTRSSDGTVRSRSAQKVAFNEHTSEAVNCCGAFQESVEGERVEVKRDGLVFKFPFGTEKKDYKVWDDTLQASAPAKFTGETQVKGVDVYKFVMEIPATKVGSRELPGSIFGSDESAVQADTYYQNTRTFFVEPNTGAAVNRVEQQKQWFSYDGVDVITTEGVIQYTDAQQKSFADSLGEQGPQLKLIGKTLPLVLGIVGVLMLIGGFVLSAGARSKE